MPIVRVEMFEGRDGETKAAMAREIAATVAEYTVNSIESVHVIFTEQPKDSWSRGLTLASRRTAEPKEVVRADYASVSEIRFDPDTEPQYLALRRDVINPGMATQEGYVSSMLLKPTDSTDRYLLVNRWTSAEAAQAYAAGDTHERLRVEAMKVLPQALQTYGAEVVHLDPE